MLLKKNASQTGASAKAAQTCRREMMHMCDVKVVDR